MKLSTILQSTMISITMMLITSCGDKPVQPSQLPPEVQNFVKQYFPNQAISFAQKDLDWFWYKYDVTLADGTHIDFDTDNVWDKIESKTSPMPSALIPANIATYVNTNFPSISIVKIDKEHGNYEVELANDLELKFDEQGTLMEMDD